MYGRNGSLKPFLHHFPKGMFLTFYALGENIEFYSVQNLDSERFVFGLRDLSKANNSDQIIFLPFIFSFCFHLVY